MKRFAIVAFDNIEDKEPSRVYDIVAETSQEALDIFKTSPHEKYHLSYSVSKGIKTEFDKKGLLCFYEGFRFLKAGNN